MYDKVTDRSRGFAFVTMGSVDEAKEAIRLFNGSVSFSLSFSHYLFVYLSFHLI